MAGTDTERRDSPSDEEIIESVKQGSTDAFGVIVERHQSAIVNYVTSILRDRTKATDVAQETFLRAYRAAPRYEPLAPVRTWLHTIATRLAISEIRREKRWGKLLFSPRDSEAHEGIMTNAPAKTPSPEASLTRQEVVERVREAVKNLPEKYRVVVALRDLQGLSYEEVENVVGCPLGTVKSRVNRGRLMLKDILREFVES
jgi:RNA polymerase sigma-70 factor (ECF subfamily)